MPPSEQMLAKALQALQQVSVEFFTATPPNLAPFGQSELRWRVKSPNGVAFKLNGKTVSRAGSQTVRPTETQTYRLTAHASTLSAEVAQVTVTVDLKACTNLFVSEDSIKEALEVVVSNLLLESPQVKNRTAPFIDVTTAGIALELRFVIEVENARNPDFNIDAWIGIGVDNSGLVPFFKEFKADLDFSFWESVLNFTISAFVGGPLLHLAIAISESNAQDKSRRDILNGVSGAIQGLLGGIPSGWAPHKVVFSDGGLDVRVCPRLGLAKLVDFRDPRFRLQVKPQRPARRSGARGGRPRPGTTPGRGARKRTTSK